MEPYAILNEKLCDNYKGCRAMQNCANDRGAIFLSGSEHSSSRKMSIDRKKCKGCGQCINYCGLFRIVEDLYQEDRAREEFAQDPRTNEFCQETERFGCDVFDKQKYFLRTIDAVDTYIAASPSDQFDILEFVDENNLFCPFQGISVGSILLAYPERLLEYRKYIVKPNYADKIFHKYTLDDLPAILLLCGGCIVGRIYGQYRVNKPNEEQIQLDALKKAFDEAMSTEA